METNKSTIEPRPYGLRFAKYFEQKFNPVGTLLTTATASMVAMKRVRSEASLGAHTSGYSTPNQRDPHRAASKSASSPSASSPLPNHRAWRSWSRSMTPATSTEAGGSAELDSWYRDVAGGAIERLRLNPAGSGGRGESEGGRALGGRVGRAVLLLILAVGLQWAWVYQTQPR